MLFPADMILEVSTRDFFQPEEISQIVLKLLGAGPHDKDRPKLLQEFLDTLPPPDKQWKILKRLRELAKTSGAEIYDFHWWDIGPMSKEITLVAKVKRDETVILVIFMWKRADALKTAAAETKNLDRGSDYHGWARDIRAPSGWRYEFQVASYQEVKTYFADWLAQPLPPMPSVEPAANDD